METRLLHPVTVPVDLLGAARRAEGDDIGNAELVRRGLARLADIEPPIVRRGPKTPANHPMTRPQPDPPATSEVASPMSMMIDDLPVQARTPAQAMRVPERRDLVMTSGELAKHLGVSYRMLDYLSQNNASLIGTAGSIGSGDHRRWTGDLVARLEIATVFANATRRPWNAMAKTLLRSGELPVAGWAIVDTAGTVRYVADGEPNEPTEAA